MADTDIIVGSVPLDVLVNIDGGGDVAIEGNYYLRSSSSSLSLIDVMVAAMGTAGLTNPGGAIRQDGRVVLNNAGGSNFTIDWTSTLLRDLFGYTANLSGSNSYVATNPSPLIWIPGYLATPTTIQGRAGYVVPHTTFHSSDDETTVETQYFGEGVWQELDWALVPTDRLSVPDSQPDGNTFQGLYRTVLKYGYRLIYHQNIELTLGSAAIDWNDAEAFGPYQLRTRISPSWYKRLVANADDYGAGIGLELKRVEEYQ